MTGENRKRMPLEEAVEEAIGYCIRNGILRDFLLRQRAEVMKMSIYEYDEERELALIRRDEREIGRQEEKENNIKSIIVLCRKFGRNREQTISELMEQCHLTQEQAQEKIACYWQ